MSSRNGEHLSSSRVQREAEVQILACLAQWDGFNGLAARGPIQIAGGVRVEVDGATPDHELLVEVYARQGRLRGGQLKKVAQDILKLALVKNEPGREAARTVIAFASQEAYDSVGGWLKQAARAFGVELVVVEIPAELRYRIGEAQGRQMMVNTDQVADDLALPT